MPSIVPPTADTQVQARLICPTCGEIPAQRIDTTTLRCETIAACVCRNGHLYVTQWETDQ